MVQQARTFRIFVSSTFSDVKEERNALQQYVFPRLRELCMQHGARFQAIDLRWGVSEEAGLDQQTMNICLSEIERCRKVSPRPNFIVLLGDRYGWRPLPPQIRASEFEQILEKVSLEERQLLLWQDDQPEGQKGWYRRDDNAVPPEYILQPRTGEYEDHDRWSAVEQKLHAILSKAITGLSLEPYDRLKYEASATEQEIWAGALRVEDAKEHVGCFFRSLHVRQTNGVMGPIHDSLPDSSIRDFVDLAKDEGYDLEAHGRLERLKGTLRSLLPTNTHEYQAEWIGAGITTDHIGQLPANLEQCLKLNDDPNPPHTLCVDVWQWLSRTILDEIGRLEQVDPLDREIAAHDDFGRERAKHFVGRADILNQIASYLEDGDNHPLVIWGESGSGKSALLARAVEQAREWFGEDRVIGRFIGATPDSSNGRSLLESLCRQISRRYGVSEGDIPSEYRELVQDLLKRLALSTAEKPLILSIDALDQLAAFDNAHNLAWLPQELPRNVRLVVSTLPSESKTAIESKLPPASILELQPMLVEEGEELLDVWLAEARRTLAKDQREDVVSKFSACRLPLYLKLAFEEVRKWKSYKCVSQSAGGQQGLSKGIPGIISDMFRRLEEDSNHGKVLVAHALGYLGAAKHGLTEDEILDVLSRNGDVMADFSRRSPKSPRVDRLPAVLWSRLYLDLEPYLEQRSADNSSLLGFYHRQLVETVVEEYLRAGQRQMRHAELADYFLEAPLWLNQNGNRFANQRKVSELPFHQAYSGKWVELEVTLTDLVFTEAKCAAGMTSDLMDDYLLSRKEAGSFWAEDCKVADFETFLSQEAHFLRYEPGLVYQQGFNASSRPHVQAAAQQLLACGSFPTTPWLQKTRGSVQQRHSGEVLSLAFWNGDRYLAISTAAREVWVWDTKTGELWRRCSAPPSAVGCLAVSPDGALLAGGFGSPEPNPFISGVYIWKSDGEILTEFKVVDWVHTLRWDSNSRIIVGAGMPIGSEAGGRVYVADVRQETCFSAPDTWCERPVLLTWDGLQISAMPVRIVMALSRDGYVHCATWDESKGKPQAEMLPLPHGERPQQAVDIGDGRICVLSEVGVYIVAPVVMENRLTISVEKLGDGIIEKPKCLAYHKNTRQLAVGTYRGELWLRLLDEDAAPQRINGKPIPVSSVCFSDSGEHIATGDVFGRAFVNRCADGALVFKADRIETAHAVRFKGALTTILYPHRIEVVELASTELKKSIPLRDSLLAIDFDVCGNLAAVLCYHSNDVAERYVVIVHLTEGQVLATLRVPSVGESLSEAKTLLAPSRFRTIRLLDNRDSCCVFLGSAQGFEVYPLLGLGRDRSLIVPNDLGEEKAGPVSRLSKDIPRISCDGFEISREQTVVAAYYSRHDWFSDVGELRSWELSGAESVCSPQISGSVNTLAWGRRGRVAIGTTSGEASSWRIEGNWMLLAAVQHNVPVISVACSQRSDLVCSASQDGLLVVWEAVTGKQLLKTFVDATPLATGFVNQDSAVYMIDKTGEVFVWSINDSTASISTAGNASSSPTDSYGSDTLSVFEPEHISQYFVTASLLETVQGQIGNEDFIGARKTLEALENTPVMSTIKEDWLSRIDIAEETDCLPESTKEMLKALEQASKQLRNEDDWEKEHKMGACIKNLYGEFQALLNRNKLRQARALAITLPEEPNYVQDVRRSWLRQIVALGLRQQFDETLVKVKELAATGQFPVARQAIEQLPIDEGLNEARALLSKQVDDMEQIYAEKREQIAEMLQELGRVGLNESRIAAIARTNNVSVENVWSYHALLVAIKEKLPSSYRKAIADLGVTMSQDHSVNKNRKWWQLWK